MASLFSARIRLRTRRPKEPETGAIKALAEKEQVRCRLAGGRMQSAANPSRGREIYREFWPSNGVDCVHLRINAGKAASDPKS